MASTNHDMWQLAQDATFQNRVQASLTKTCIAISTESPTSVPFHRERAIFVVQVLSSPLAPTNWVQLFTNSVATDANCISDATQAGTVALTGANVAAQAALVTDAHIDSAISGQFNSFIREPMA